MSAYPMRWSAVDGQGLKFIRQSLTIRRHGVLKADRERQVVNLIARIDDVLTYLENCERHGGMPTPFTIRRLLTGAEGDDSDD